MRKWRCIKDKGQKKKIFLKNSYGKCRESGLKVVHSSILSKRSSSCSELVDEVVEAWNAGLETLSLSDVLNELATLG